MCKSEKTLDLRITESKKFNYIFHLAWSKEHVTNETDMSINVWQCISPHDLLFFPDLPACSLDYSPTGTNNNLKAVFPLNRSWFFSTSVNQTSLNFFSAKEMYKRVPCGKHCQVRLPAYRRRDLYKQSSDSILGTIWLHFLFTANIYLVTVPDQGLLPIHFTERSAPDLIFARERLELSHYYFWEQSKKILHIQLL